MDFGQAALLIAIVVGLSQLAKTLLPDNLESNKAIVALVVFAISIAAVFLVAESAWGHEQIVGGKSLDELGWSSRLLVAILLGGGASFAWEGFTSLRNIGQNQPTQKQREALDAGADRLLQASMPDAGGSHDTSGYKFADDHTG